MAAERHNTIRFCSKWRSKRWLDLTCVCKTSCCLLVIAVLCFFAEEYITFGMWTANEYQEVGTCTEEFYNFQPSESGDSLLEDKSLMTNCGVYSSNISANSNIFSHVNTTQDNPPDIITKCGTQAPSLISFHGINTPSGSNRNIVPNVVHYISLGTWNFTFLNYLSFRSTERHIKPDYIFVHGDGLPRGEWWNRTLSEVPNIYHVTRKRPIRVQGRRTRWLEHSTDIIRLQTILDNGGIYLDTDILVVKSFTQLRHYELTLGRETSYGLGSGIIMAQPHSPFVCVWFNVFREYNPFPWNWAYYAVHTPNKLAKVIPNRIHIEEDTMHRPSFEEAELLFEKTVDWSKNYAVHVWKRYGYVPSSPAEIGTLDTTLGEIMRYIYYGSSDVVAGS